MMTLPLFRQTIVIALLLTAGCATVPTEGELKGSLTSTAELYWKLRMEDKYEETYAMEDKEGLPRYAEYLNKVMAIKKINISSYAVKNITVDGDKAIVEVVFTVRFPLIPKPVSQYSRETWLYRGGKWWHRLP